MIVYSCINTVQKTVSQLCPHLGFVENQAKRAFRITALGACRRTRGHTLAQALIQTGQRSRPIQAFGHRLASTVG